MAVLNKLPSNKAAGGTVSVTSSPLTKLGAGKVTVLKGDPYALHRSAGNTRMATELQDPQTVRVLNSGGVLFKSSDKKGGTVGADTGLEIGGAVVVEGGDFFSSIPWWAWVGLAGGAVVLYYNL